MDIAEVPFQPQLTVRLINDMFSRANDRTVFGNKYLKLNSRKFTILL